MDKKKTNEPSSFEYQLNHKKLNDFYLNFCQNVEINNKKIIKIQSHIRRYVYKLRYKKLYD